VHSGSLSQGFAIRCSAGSNSGRILAALFMALPIAVAALSSTAQSLDTRTTSSGDATNGQTSPGTIGSSEPLQENKLGATSDRRASRNTKPDDSVPSTPFIRRSPPNPNIANIRTITIKWKRTKQTADPQPPTTGELKNLMDAAGMVLPAFKVRGYGNIVFTLPRTLSRIEAEEVAARIRKLPEVEYASPGVTGRTSAVPNDPRSAKWNPEPKRGVGG
jgi:hypothetical protein